MESDVRPVRPNAPIAVRKNSLRPGDRGYLVYQDLPFAVQFQARGNKRKQLEFKIAATPCFVARLLDGWRAINSRSEVRPSFDSH